VALVQHRHALSGQVRPADPVEVLDHVVSEVVVAIRTFFVVLQRRSFVPDVGRANQIERLPFDDFDEEGLPVLYVCGMSLQERQHRVLDGVCWVHPRAS